MTQPPAAPPGGEVDIRYEVVLMGQFAELCVDRHAARDHRTAAGTPPRLIYTALLGRTLLHIRNILEFVKKGPNPETRSATTFNPSWDYQAAKDRVQPLYADICTALSHISVARGKPGWNLATVADSALREYEDAVSGATLGDIAMLREGAQIARAAVDRATQRRNI